MKRKAEASAGRASRKSLLAVDCLDGLSEGMEKLRTLAELMNMGAESRGVLNARTVGRVGGLMADELTEMREWLTRLNASLH